MSELDPETLDEFYQEAATDDFTEYSLARGQAYALMMVDCDTRHVPSVHACGCKEMAEHALDSFMASVLKIAKDMYS